MRQGRFDRGLHDAMRVMNASIHYDKRMYLEDIQGSLAWAEGLELVGILSADECQAVGRGLSEIGNCRTRPFGGARGPHPALLASDCFSQPDHVAQESPRGPSG